jgi:multicomponent Na+:H+ antiporter subunit C
MAMNAFQTFHLYALAAVLLFWMGFYGIITGRELLRKIMALNVMGGGVFLLLISVARRNAIEQQADPVPHAMVLTGIVVALSATAFAIALARRIAQVTGRTTLRDEEVS